jgi:uncharacterized membrane protein
MKSITLTVASLVAILMVAASVDATSIERTNYMTFSAPFALPGVSLPAGTYIFEAPLEDSLDVVRVKSRDGLHVYFSGLTQTVERPLERTVRPAIVLGEAPVGAPTPVKVWFPAGQRRGHQFIY